MLLGIPYLTRFSNGVASFQVQINAYNPIAFYDAGLSNVWQDSAGTTPATSNADVVGRWDDLSGNGYHVTQATTANKPTYRTSAQNGLPVIRFDGSDDFLRNTSFFDLSLTTTFFAVAKYNVSVDATQSIFEVSDGSINTGFLLFHLNQTTFRHATLYDIKGSDIRNGVFYLHTGRSNTSNIQYWVNGSSVSTLAGSLTNNTVNQLDIGALSSAPGYAIDGDICSIILFNSALSTTDRETIQTLINNRWGIY